jgi:chitodextrinase
MGRRPAATAAAAALLMCAVIAPSQPTFGAPASVAAAAETIDVTVDAGDIAADNVNGLTFKGFGVLSANSTSALLMDYKAQHPEAYARLLRILFGGDHPIMGQVKIEMGNDRNNSTGSDPATMRRETERANVARHPGFQLAADAKKVNTGLRVSILRWNAPAWANTNDKVYTWYKNTILAAYREYGFMVDYVNPGVNESTPDLTWTKQYANRVRTDTAGYVSDDPALAGFRPGEADLYHQIKVVISDEAGIGSFGGAMTSDAELRDAVAVAGYHYNTNDDSGNNFTRLAEQYDKEVWNSEAQATFSNSAFRPNNNTPDPTVPGTGIGGTGSALEMANTIVKGFVMSRRTHFVYQPAIGSFFEGGQYAFKELVSARDPWSGWIHYDAGLAVLQHFTSFSAAGWENDANTAGIWRVIPQASASTATGTNPVVGRNGLPNYMTIAAPDASDFSTVIVNDSEYPRTYQITPVGFDLGADPKLAAWQTAAAGAGEVFNANYKRHTGDLTPDASGAYTVSAEPYSIVTVTSLDVTGDPQWRAPLPVEGERTVLDADPAQGVLWADGFDYAGKTVPVIGAGGTVTGQTEGFVDSRGGDTGAIPLYTWDRNGAFEAVQADDGNYVLRQQVDRTATGVGGAWNSADPITGVGDLRWTNYQAGVDVRFDRGAASDNYAAVGARSTGGGSSHSLSGTPYALRLGSDGTWQFRRTGTTVSSGTVADFDATAWHRLAIRVAGTQVTGFVDGNQVFTWIDNVPYLSGRVDLASGFYHTRFDNLRIERLPGYLPYYPRLLDNLEMNDLADPPAAKLVYGGDWRHANGGGMYEYQRSSSTSQAPGATLAYTFTGSGMDVTGPNDGSARLNVRVDGELVATNLRTQSATNFQQTVAVRGLKWGRHTVTLEVIAGTLVVDAVGVLGTPPAQPASIVDVADALAAARQIERSPDFTDQEWALLQANISAASLAVADPAGYRLDGEGARQIVSRLQAASFPLANRVVSLPQVWRATYVGQVPGRLPATLPATLTDGTTRELPVTWNLDRVDFSQAWATVAVAGSYGTATTTAWVEVVPQGLRYLADVNGTAAGSLGYESPAYRAVAELVGGDLLNDAPDRVYEGDATWGLWAQNAAGGRDFQYKGIVPGDYSKMTTTGVYTANQVGATLSYTFTLPAGRHTIVAGSNSWWPSPSRGYDVFLDYDGTAHQVGSRVTLDEATPARVLSYDIDLAADGPVTIRLRATNNQSPMLSWAAAVQGVYSVSYDLNGGIGTLPETRRDLLWTDVGLDAPGSGLRRPAFEFAGWNTAADGSGVTVTATTAVSALAQTSATLYAQWVPAVPDWQSSQVYTEGDLVYHAGRAYQAQWWTKNEAPGSSAWGAWAELAAYVHCDSGFYPEWTRSWIYLRGETVEHAGQLWTARWWTRDQEPDGSRRGSWQRIGSC